MPAAIEFRDVSLALPDGRLLIDHVSLALAAGTTTAILGRSGSGKTTLLRMTNRLLAPTSGAVFVEGADVASADLVQLRRGIGYVIQETGLFPHFTVARNVMAVPEISAAQKKDFPARVGPLLEQVGLDPAMGTRLPWQLSGGQRQRVGLARALAADPPILLMDEPFGALDPLTRAEMQDMLLALLARLADEGKPKTVLLVTHDLDEALYLASRIVLVEAGRIAADLAPGDFLRSSEPAVEQYVNAFHRGEQARA
jgi:osmoprotectant transport system ATP-binding protein